MIKKAETFYFVSASLITNIVRCIIMFKKKLLILKKINFPLKLMVVAIIISTFSSTIGLIIPLFTGKIIDSFNVVNSFKVQFLILLLLVFILNGIFNGLSIYVLSIIGEKIIFSLKNLLSTHIVHLKLSFFDKNDSGNLISRITNDTSIINEFLSNKLPKLFPQLITIIGSIIMLIYMDWIVSLVALISMPIFIIIIIPLGKIMRNISFSTQKENANYTSLLSKILTHIKLIKISNTENEECLNSYIKLKKIYNLGLKEAKINSILQPLTSLIMMLLISIILGVGGVRVASHAISIGTLISMIFYVIQLTSPLANLSTLFAEYQKAVGASERINEIIEEKTENINQGNELSLNLKEKNIFFKNVSFKYGNINILKSISFCIPVKKVTAIVGPSGSGKTTILNLIARFYTPNHGIITLGDSNINNFKLSDWRNNIGFVMQDNPMIKNLLINNMLYGVNRNKINKNTISYYSKLSNCSNFISNLENGYRTNIGENGNNLSGGQKQRLDIARNFIKDPNLLLLDEVTSNLDSESEKKIQDSLFKLMNNRTTVIIAHRLSTIKQADQIIFIDKGEITGRGTHTELMKFHKRYQSFVYTQKLD